MLNRTHIIEVMAHGQVCNKHPLETRHMPGNERQPFACAINRRGLSEDEREKGHNWRHKFISAAYVSHSLTSDATFSTKIAVNPGQIRYLYFLNQGCTPVIYDSTQNSWSLMGDNEMRYITRAYKTIGANVQASVARATQHKGFVYPCFKYQMCA